MKVIDLLIKVEKNEVKDKTKVKFSDNDEIYQFWEKDKNFHGFSPSKRTFSEGITRIIDGVSLNTEVEIIEEDKEIKELDYCEENTFSNMKEITYLTSEERRLLDSNFKSIKEKFDELIKAVNELKKGK